MTPANLGRVSVPRLIRADRAQHPAIGGRSSALAGRLRSIGRSRARRAAVHGTRECPSSASHATPSPVRIDFPLLAASQLHKASIGFLSPSDAKGGERKFAAMFAKVWRYGPCIHPAKQRRLTLPAQSGLQTDVFSPHCASQERTLVHGMQSNRQDGHSADGGSVNQSPPAMDLRDTVFERPAGPEPTGRRRGHPQAVEIASKSPATPGGSGSPQREVKRRCRTPWTD